MLRRAKQFAHDWWFSRKWPHAPEQVSVEITAACDAKCVHCPRQEMDRDMKPMPAELFKKLVANCAELGVREICPNGYGEICTMPLPQLTEYFGYIAASGWKGRILINTNGNRMNEERARLFIEHGVRLINVVIDGATAETAEAIRVNLKFDQIEENVRRLIAMRDRAGKRYPKVRVGMILMPQNEPEMPAFYAKWNGVADYVEVSGFSSRIESVKPAQLVQLGVPGKPVPEPVASASATACVKPFKDLNIWADGIAVLCCEDWNEEHVVGDLKTQTIAEIWRGERLAEVRRKHRAGCGGDVPLCAKCDNWVQPTSGARLWS
jgi:hypothetical protein